MKDDGKGCIGPAMRANPSASSQFDAAVIRLTLRNNNIKFLSKKGGLDFERTCMAYDRSAAIFQQEIMKQVNEIKKD